MCNIGNPFKPTLDIPSPRDIISRNDIQYSAADKKITVKNLNPNIWLTTVQDTNSMDPTVDAGHTCILTSDFQPQDLAVGDVIVYEVITSRPILHRIVKIESDSQGRKFTLKGDNNYRKDSAEVRDAHIKWLLIGIIY